MNGQTVTEYGVCAMWKGGYGFLRPEVGPEDGDVWVHFSSLELPPGTYRKLVPGQRVMFTRTLDREGREQAVNVRLVEGGNR